MNSHSVMYVQGLTCVFELGINVTFCDIEHQTQGEGGLLCRMSFIISCGVSQYVGKEASDYNKNDEYPNNGWINHVLYRTALFICFTEMNNGLFTLL